MVEKFIEDTRKQAEVAMRVWRKRAELNPLAVSNLFLGAPEGDFKWEDFEGGDWFAIPCHDKDCPHPWHRCSYSLERGRESGKQYVEKSEIMENEDWETSWRWEEGENFAEYGIELRLESDMYFKSWIDYYLWSLETGMVLFEEEEFNLEDTIGWAKKNLRALQKGMFADPTSSVFCANVIHLLASREEGPFHRKEWADDLPGLQWVEFHEWLFFGNRHYVQMFPFSEVWGILEDHLNIKSEQLLHQMRGQDDVGRNVPGTT